MITDSKFEETCREFGIRSNSDTHHRYFMKGQAYQTFKTPLCIKFPINT